MGLLDHLHMQVWPKDVFNETRVENPLSQLKSGLLHLTHRLRVAKLVEEGDVGVDLVDPAEAHGEGGRAEVLEGQLEAFPVQCQR